LHIRLSRGSTKQNYRRFVRTTFSQKVSKISVFGDQNALFEDGSRQNQFVSRGVQLVVTNVDSVVSQIAKMEGEDVR
jgi:hypothetical protein